MSYDIDFGVKVEGTDKIIRFTSPEYANPTYNVGKIFRKCMDWDFKQGEWYKVSEVYSHIKSGLFEVQTFPYKYEKYEPTNGWGSVGTVCETLSSVLSKIEEIEKWWELTKEHFYIKF